MTTAEVDLASRLLDEVDRLAPTIRACRDDAERERRQPEPLIAAMVDAGLFRMWRPAAYGGFEVDPLTFVRVVEAVARIDGSTGWTLMIGAEGGAFAAYFSEQRAREMFSDPRSTIAGSFNPNGRAVPVEGGFRVSGRWPWNSGIHHASWVGGNCLIFDGDTPRTADDGTPFMRLMFFPAGDCEVLDTWYSGGLRGTGSTDFAVEDVFVPGDRHFSVNTTVGRLPGPLYRAPIGSLLPIGIPAVALGIARAAIDELIDLAGRKKPYAARSLVRDRPLVQIQVAQCEATLSAARAFLFESLGDVWGTLSAGELPSAERYTRLYLAGVHAGESALQVVDTMYKAGGGTAAYSSSALDRCMRDVHVATQHVAVSPNHYERYGRSLLGMPAS